MQRYRKTDLQPRKDIEKKMARKRKKEQERREEEGSDKGDDFKAYD
jgi:hypothetical protein